MKKLIFSLFIIIIAKTHAQTEIESLTSSQKTSIELTQAKELLQLTAEQAAKYEKILKKYNNLESEILKLKKDTIKRIEKRTAYIFKRSEEVKAILTEDQYAKYCKWMGLDIFWETNKNKIRVDSCQHKPLRLTPEEKLIAEVKHAQEQLQLSSEQTIQYEKIVRKYSKLHNELKSISADSAQNRKNKRVEFIKNRSAEMEVILTPEQYENYREWMGIDRMQLIEKNKFKSDSLRR